MVSNDNAEYLMKCIEIKMLIQLASETGIDISKEYKVTLDNDNESFIATGKELKFNGISIDIPSSLSSELILYEEI